MKVIIEMDDALSDLMERAPHLTVIANLARVGVAEGHFTRDQVVAFIGDYLSDESTPPQPAARFTVIQGGISDGS